MTVNTFEPTPIQQAIVDCVSALPNQLPRSGVAKLLRGTDSVRVAAYREHDFFGRLADYPRKIIMHDIDVLLQIGVIETDFQRHLKLKK